MKHRLAATNAGFTLIELLVTLALIAVLAAVAVPTYRSFFVNQQLSSASSNLLSSLLQARSEAMRLGTFVTVVPLDGANWASGWQLSRVSNTCALTGDPFGKSDALNALITVNSTGTSNAFAHSSPSYTYTAAGFPYTSCASPYYSGAMSGMLRFIATETGRERVVIVSNSGRARTCDPSKETCTAD